MCIRDSTYRGIINNLDYITGMGFDAIWISPIVENYRQDYHGYAAKNIYKLNPNFGTEDDFKEMIKKCHEKNVWVMVDVVANHMGNLDENFTENVPFNSCLLYTSPSPRDLSTSRMPSSA